MSLYGPSWWISSSWVPICWITPLSITIIQSACIRDVIRWEIIITVAFSISFFSSLRILLSVSVSTADRESSNTRIGASFISILAIATRCFCPPDKVTPRSPTMVSYPSVKWRIDSSTQAISAAWRISSSRSFSFVMPIFSRMVLEKRNGSWSTMPIFWRRY